MINIIFFGDNRLSVSFSENRLDLWQASKGGPNAIPAEPSR